MQPQQARIEPHNPNLQMTCTVCLSALADLDGPGRVACTDCKELLGRAIKAISKARQDGCLRQGYHPSSWREAKNRLNHALTHIVVYKRSSTEGPKSQPREDHLAHAICDLVMSYDRD